MDKKCYCVTGGAGFIVSYLVKLLLLKGHTVHATLRDLGDKSKTKPLTSLEGANERLKLFKADLLEEGSFDEAVQGCHGVFHVATPIPTSPVTEEYLVEIVLKGTLNVLRTCSRTPSVERFVYTSSMAAASAMDYEGQVMDESIWTPVDILRSVSPEHPLKAYFIAKTLAEQAAAQYGEEHGLKVVSILPAIVGGPFTVFSPSMSCDLILFPLTGNEGAYSTVKYIRQFVRSYLVVHIEDICEAQILLMESPNATGRYFCSAASGDIVCKNSRIADLTDWWRQLASESRGMDCLDSLLISSETQGSPKGIEGLLAIALKCIQTAPERPTVTTLFEDLIGLVV